MAVKLKKPAFAVAEKANGDRGDSTQESLLTPGEHIHRIAALAKRIDEYIKFMCQIDEHSGLSAEMRTRSLIAFYEKLNIAEQQLGRIYDDLRLE